MLQGLDWIQISAMLHCLQPRHSPSNCHVVALNGVEIGVHDLPATYSFLSTIGLPLTFQPKAVFFFQADFLDGQLALCFL